ncbi:MAG: hypothetical protein A3H42_06305 [Deltaproteobacteria bacterium RIFCSPLOWO2_02_FULL_46_8]|nr:MAG: hypothetical protein A3H42_06305 [Deltaproteobacteria bacterium RIFCSPLOWO2_02_FULL_46_8]
MENKIKTFETFAPLREQLKREGKKLVHCHGLFDLVHPGHILHFKAAKKLGDVLVVTITPDQYARKGPGRPVFNERLRLETLSSIQYIDCVILNHWPTAIEAIHNIKPELYVKGQDYQESQKDLTGNIALEVEAVRKHGGDVIFTQEEMFSSSNLLNKFFSKLPAETDEYLKNFRSKQKVEDIIQNLKNLSELNVLVVGEAILDQYVYSIPLQKAPKEAIVTTRFDSDESFAGGSVAVANHLAGFCKKVSLISCFGPDEGHLQFIRSKLGSNVELKNVTVDDRPTIVKRRFLDKTWMTKMFEVQFLNDSDISETAENEILAILDQQISRHDFVVVTDFGHGMFTERIRDYLVQCPKFVALNVQTNSANLGFNLATKYRKCNYLSIDEPELKLAAQIQYGDIPLIAAQLKKRLNIPNFMVTRGPKGSLFLANGREPNQTPIFSTKIVDRTGAGDAFFSITAPCVYRGFDPEVIGFVGNCVGALAVEIVCNREPVNPVNLYKFIQHLLK